MSKIIFRQEELIDRVDERKFIIKWFEKVPKELLWIYGPKSTGKTTVIEYIIENELFNDFKLFKSNKYNVKYINFRRKLFGSYDTFLNSMLLKDDDGLSEEFKISLSLGVLKVDYKTYDKIKNKEVDLFDIWFEELKTSKKKNILIFDEIQALKEIYIDEERELLNEFLNFCVSLTKETHLAHVVLLSSNTIFINELYNNAKLKVTSQFFKMSHLKKEIVEEWLSDKFKKDEIELIWDYLGGSIAFIQRAMRRIELFRKPLDEILDIMRQEAWSEIKMTFRELRKIDKYQEIKEFKILAQKILDQGYFLSDDDDNKEMDFAIEYFCNKEILFFEPMNNRVYSNSRIYEKAFKIL